MCLYGSHSAVIVSSLKVSMEAPTHSMRKKKGPADEPVISQFVASYSVFSTLHTAGQRICFCDLTSLEIPLHYLPVWGPNAM